MPSVTMSRAPVRVATVLALAVVLIITPSAGAHHPAGTNYKSGPDHEFGEMVDYPLVFPVDGPYTLSDWFWALRGGGSLHHAQDIMAARWTPVLAVATGTVVSMNFGGNCCSLVIRHDDGWRSWYIHLNNDSEGLPPGTCDGQGWGIADGITVGTKVQAGQLIAWVGSSGNASCAGPHLHFELHDPHGVIVNPYESLLDPVNPAYCTGPEVGCTRIAGANRYETATAVSEAHHEKSAQVNRVYVTSGENFPDALAGAGVAGGLDAPLLLVRPTSVPAVVTEELTRLAPQEIVILGGIAAVSEAVEATLGSPVFGSPSVIRVSGANRYETAVAISQHVFADGEPDVIVIASGETFADALPAGPLAAAFGGPVLLTRSATLPNAVAAEILRLGPSTVYVLGGPAAIGDDVVAALESLGPLVTRVFGPDRYTTAVAAADLAFPAPETPVDRVYVTVGTAFPDGLTGGAAAGMVGSPLLLVPSGHLPNAVRDEIVRLAPGEIIILGGPNSVSSAVELALRSLIDTD